MGTKAPPKHPSRMTPKELDAELERRFNILKNPAADIAVENDPRVNRFAALLEHRTGVRRPGKVGIVQMDTLGGGYWDGPTIAKSVLGLTPDFRTFDDDIALAVMAHEWGHHLHRERLRQNRRVVQKLLKWPIPRKLVSVIAHWMHRKEEKFADRFMRETVGPEVTARFLSWMRGRQKDDSRFGHMQTNLHDEHENVEDRIAEVFNGDKRKAKEFFDKVRALPELRQRNDLYQEGFTEEDLITLNKAREARIQAELAAEARDGRVVTTGGSRSRRKPVERTRLADEPSLERPAVERPVAAEARPPSRPETRRSYRESAGASASVER